MKAGMKWLIALSMLVALTGLGWAVMAKYGAAEDSARPDDIEWWSLQEPAMASASTIEAEGELQPLKTLEIAAPFDGSLVDVPVVAGQRVKAQEVLFSLDPRELDAELREAEVAALRAQEQVESLVHWEKSPDVQALNRQLRQARHGLEQASKRLQESQDLFEKGLIPRMELDQAQQEKVMAESELASAQDGLQAGLRRGDARQLRIAQLESDSRANKLEQLRSRKAEATVRAPWEGVVLPPTNPDPFGAGAAKRELGPGARVTQREAVWVLADTKGWRVTVPLDSKDADQVKPGDDAEVEIGGAAWQGKVLSISSVARRSAQGPGSASLYDATLSLNGAEGSRGARLRIGTKVQVRIHTAAPTPESDNLWQVPAEALNKPPSVDSTQVWAKDPSNADDQGQAVRVTVVREAEGMAWVRGSLRAGQQLRLASRQGG